jgi:hypothetical protein
MPRDYGTREGETVEQWRARLDREQAEEQRKIEQLVGKIEDALTDAGIRKIHFTYSGGNDEGGGEIADEQAKAIVDKAIEGEELGWHASYTFVDKFVDQLGYGSWAGEFSAYGEFDGDVATGRIIEGTVHGQESTYVDHSW